MAVWLGKDSDKVALRSLKTGGALVRNTNRAEQTSTARLVSPRDAEAKVPKRQRALESGAGAGAASDPHRERTAGGQLQLRTGGRLAGIGGAEAVMENIGQPDDPVAQAHREIVGGVAEGRGQAVHGQVEIGWAEDGGEWLLPGYEARGTAHSKHPRRGGGAEVQAHPGIKQHEILA